MLLFGSQLRSYRDLPYPVRGVLDAASRRARRDAPRPPARASTSRRTTRTSSAAPSRSRTRSSAASTTRRISTTSSEWSARFELSTRPEPKLGTDEEWDFTEGALRAALEKREIEYAVNAGDGAFYGPKIDLHMTDVLGRSWQMGTIQLDSQMPKNFGLSYMGADNREHTPYVIHRALLGSLERFIGHPDRALRRRLPVLARAGPGPRAAGRRGDTSPPPTTSRPVCARPATAPRPRSRPRRSASGSAPPSSRRSRSRSSTATGSPTRASRCASAAASSRPSRFQTSLPGLLTSDV